MYAIRSYYAIDCDESGSTLRFVLPIAMVHNQRSTFTGAAGLAARPMNPYFDNFISQGIRIEQAEHCFPLTVIGRLQAGAYARITSYNVCYTKLLRMCTGYPTPDTAAKTEPLQVIVACGPLDIGEPAGILLALPVLKPLP